MAVAKPPAATAAARTQLVLQLAVFLDLLGVMLVVPNLIHRFKELGISTANYGLVSSVYSASQIVGGLLIGYLGDNVLGRKRVLLLSFAGAGLSYLLVGVADSLGLLVLSRVVVGLVKQTMTTSTALVSPYLPVSPCISLPRQADDDHLHCAGHPAELYLPHISPVSPPYLPCISPVSPCRSRS